jgi:hypothetical protein
LRRYENIKRAYGTKSRLKLFLGMNIAADVPRLDGAEILGLGKIPLPGNDPLSQLLEQADEFCARFGVGDDIILETYTEISDWAFFIKVDALHETACRDLTARLLRTRQGGGALDREMSAFIDDIEFQGRGSVLRLIELARRPRDYVRLLKCVRRVRNACAHNVSSVNMTLTELIEQLPDRTQLLRAFSGMAEEDYDEAKYTRLIRNDPAVLRFGILQQSMVLLCQLHANFCEADKGGVYNAAADNRKAPQANSSLAFNGGPKLEARGANLGPCATDENEKTNEADHSRRPAVLSRYSFTNPKRPNQLRSLWSYIVTFSAKGLVAIGGLAAGAALFTFYGIWPAIAVGVVSFIPLALDQWTPGAWKGHCPHCDAEIAVAASKKIAFGVGCPVCAGKFRLREKSFVAM